MTIFRSRAAISLAAVAAVAMSATPALARDHWHHRHHHSDGIDGGDLLAGLLVVGGVAAIATAASNSKSRQDAAPARYPGGPEADDVREQGYGDAPAPEPAYGDQDRAPAADPGDRDEDQAPDSAAPQRSFDAAVDACSAELERGDQRIDSVDSVRSMGERYSVEGRLSDGRPYACSVDDSGHIRSVAVDGHAMI